MTKRNKELTGENIRSLKEETSTNLWQGIKEGMDMFKDHANSGRAPAVMVLTDGQPNTGYVEDLFFLSFPSFSFLWQLLIAIGTLWEAMYSAFGL